MLRIFLFLCLFIFNSTFAAQNSVFINYKNKDFNLLLPQDTDAQKLVNVAGNNYPTATFYMFNTPNNIKIVATVYKVKHAVSLAGQKNQIVEMVNGIKKSVGLDISKEMNNVVTERIKGLTFNDKYFQFYRYTLVDRVLSFYSTTNDNKLLLLMISVPEYISRKDEELISVILNSIKLV